MFVIPIERANPVRSTPWVVYSLIVINAGVWVLTWWREPRIDIAQQFGFIPAEHGTFSVFFPKVKVDLSFFFGYIEVATIKSPALVAIGVWLGEQSLLGLVTWLAGVQGYVGIGFWAHVGGLLAGGALGLVYTWLGFPSRYFESIGGEIDEYMACPVCGKAGRQMPKGRYRCKTCHSRLSIDAEGEVHVVWSGKTAEQKDVDKLKGTLVAGVIALAAVIYAVSQWRR